jgi:hypothetical protein
MKQFWARLSPWLDLPMNQQHWKLLVGFAIASTPMGFGAGHVARQYLDRTPEQPTESPMTAGSEPESAQGPPSLAARAVAAASGASATETVAMVAVPAGLGWMASLVLFPPRS